MSLGDDRVRDLIARATVCDMTIPWSGEPGDLSRRAALPGRLREVGYDFVSLTVAEDSTSCEVALKQTANVRAFVLGNPDRFVLAESVSDIERAKQQGKLAIGLHFQGSMPVGHDLDLVEGFWRLGVRHMLMAYNERNYVADGCHEPTDCGLSRFGYQLIEEMNRVGMIVDIAHTGYRASLEAIEASKKTVIVSHGNIWALNNHPRCYRDDQLRALAKQGGVIGLTGMGVFLGNNEATVDRFVQCIRYVTDLVGHEHVGIGSDYLFDIEAASAYVSSFPNRWPESGGYALPKINQLEPESLPAITSRLLADGFTEDQVLDVLGRNWLRVLRSVWN